jgi:hypothetical protein
VEWVDVNDRLPQLKDDSVLVYFDNGGIDMVHIEDYFGDITSGVIDGKQTYTKWYLSQGVTHWMPLPEPPK